MSLSLFTMWHSEKSLTSDPQKERCCVSQRCAFGILEWGAVDIPGEAGLALNDFLMNPVSTQKTSSTRQLLWQSKPAPKGVLPMLVGNQWATGDSIGSFCHGSESQWNRSSFGLGWYDPFRIKWEHTAYVVCKAHNIRILLMPYFDFRSWVLTAKRQSVAEWNQVALRIGREISLSISYRRRHWVWEQWHLVLLVFIFMPLFEFLLQTPVRFRALDSLVPHTFSAT